MNHRLERRLRHAMDGNFDTNDTPRKVFQDALTDLLRMEERLEAMEKFVFFAKGYLKNDSHPASMAADLRKRLGNLEADFKRMTQRGRRPCK